MPEAPGSLAPLVFSIALLVPLGMTALGLLYAIVLTILPASKSHKSHH